MFLIFGSSRSVFEYDIFQMGALSLYGVLCPSLSKGVGLSDWSIEYGQP